MHQTLPSLIVVEDEPLIAIMIKDIVGELGWTVDRTAYSETEAFTALSECRPSLALLDIKLGQTTSLAVASSCRDRSIPIIFMTGYTATDVPNQCGSAPILAKPFTADQLAVAIRRAVAPEGV